MFMNMSSNQKAVLMFILSDSLFLSSIRNSLSFQLLYLKYKIASSCSGIYDQCTENGDRLSAKIKCI